MTETYDWQREREEAKAKAAAEGRTYFTGRCNCYRGHNSNSGRCNVRQSGGFYTTPERHGVCDDCWQNCGFASPERMP